jgi:quercetin dioxygenase-like cupin family protein
MANFKKIILSLIVVSVVGMAVPAHGVETLFNKKLPDTPGKEIQVVTVDYAPGAMDAVHRHDAHAVVYVLEWDLEMQVRGGPFQHLGPG